MPAGLKACACGYVRTETATSRPMMDESLESPTETPAGGSSKVVPLLVGGGIMLLGVFVTISSYKMAVAKGGGTYTIAYGAIAVGAIQIVRTLFSRE